MLNNIITLIIVLLLISCNDSATNETNKQPIKGIDSAKEKTISNIGETLTPEASTLVKDWKEYEIVDENIIEFYSITTDEALSKAKSLSIAAQQLKDSIRIPQFDRLDIKIRLNVFYNNTLRLADMQNITSIESEEVKIEISNILNAFSAINSKINNLTNQQQLEKQLIDFQNN
tara:strand:- start:171541 stop:172062 length:522 start_codon:yes stop_codon:yes gene_type:complete